MLCHTLYFHTTTCIFHRVSHYSLSMHFFFVFLNSCDLILFAFLLQQPRARPASGPSNLYIKIAHSYSHLLLVHRLQISKQFKTFRCYYSFFPSHQLLLSTFQLSVCPSWSLRQDFVPCEFPSLAYLGV